MKRVTCTELLDDDQGTPEEIGSILDDLWRINRWLGGVASNLRLLEYFFACAGMHPRHILDVGAGDGRLAAYLANTLRRRGRHVQVSVLDRRLSHLQHARPAAGGLPPVAGDALMLPFADNSFDVVMCNLFFHHFTGDRAERLLENLGAVAREAVLVNDLERSLLPYLFIRCARPFTRSRLSRHDALASVRQAYRPGELAAIPVAPGFTAFEVRRLIPFRLGLILWKQGRVMQS